MGQAKANARVSKYGSIMRYVLMALVAVALLHLLALVQRHPAIRRAESSLLSPGEESQLAAGLAAAVSGANAAKLPSAVNLSSPLSVQFAVSGGGAIPTPAAPGGQQRQDLSRGMGSSRNLKGAAKPARRSLAALKWTDKLWEDEEVSLEHDAHPAPASFKSPESQVSFPQENVVEDGNSLLSAAARQEDASRTGRGPGAVAMLQSRESLVDWLENVASLQEVEAVEELRRILELNRETAKTTAEVEKQGKVGGWFTCGAEGEICECTSGTVRFGDPEVGRWEQVSSKTSIKCSISEFKNRDPAPGQFKACQCFHDLAKCPNGQRVDKNRCPGSGERACRAGCSPQPGLRPAPNSPRPRGKLCSRDVPVELLWSCDSHLSRRPRAGTPDAEAQEVLDRTTEEMCKDAQLAKNLEVYLDCEFIDNYLSWTTPSSEWLQEAYVTYVAGPKGSKYEWQATNLIRSVQLFSKRPIVVMVFSESFIPPWHWHGLKNLIVYRLHPISNGGVSFNFNKVRSMITARIMSGIMVDTDQLILPGMDELFKSTRREVTSRYPWPIMPVHWMARDDVAGNPYAAYAYREWKGAHSTRWGHAHPTWTYWSLPFLVDLLQERMLAQLSFMRGQQLEVWNLSAAVQDGSLAMLRNKQRFARHVSYQAWMIEDEDMLNVNLWRDGANKTWCKFDLEPGLFLQGYEMEKKLYWDPLWFPDGLPVLFLSSHNTKNFEATDWLLKLLEVCSNNGQGPGKLNCPPQGAEQPRGLPRWLSY